MKKIAVMLPYSYRRGSLRAAKSLAKGIVLAARQRNDPVQVVFSYVQDGNYDPDTDFNDLLESGIGLRETTWQVYPRDFLAVTTPFVELERRQKLISNTYCLPVDGANDFNDCDLWIIISDRLPAPLFPLRKYCCVIYDYIQRYVPEIFGDDPKVWRLQEETMFSLVRHARRVFVTTPSTRADLISYAGVPGSHIVLLEMDFEPPIDAADDLPGVDLPSEYFIWTTNMSAHKNHVHALNALEMYYQDLSGSLDLVVTGVNSEYLDVERKFDPGDPIPGVPHIKFSRDMILNNPGLKKRLHILGNVSERVYGHVLRRAQFLWHPNKSDNGTFSVVEAALFHHPSLSARYPAMEYINQKFNLNLSFFNPHNTLDMAKSLLAMEKNYQNIQLPENKTILQRSWQVNSSLLYQAISEIIQDRS